jgi:hypothetical protein
VAGEAQSPTLYVDLAAEDYTPLKLCASTGNPMLFAIEVTDWRGDVVAHA